MDIALARGQSEEALKLLQELPFISPNTLLGQMEVQTYYGLALVGVKRYKEACLALHRAVQGVEELRRQTPGERIGFFQGGPPGGHLRVYRELVATLGEMSTRKETLPAELRRYGEDPATAAFYFAEATKGRVLLEAMAEAARRQTGYKVPPELAQREQDLLNCLAAIEAQWEKHYAKGGEALANFQKQRDELQRQLDGLVAELRKSHPRYAALKYPQPLRSKEIPLKKDDILLEFALGEKASFLFRVEPGGATRVFRLGVGQEDLEKLVKKFMDPMQNKTIEGFSPEQGYKLYTLLLEPALKDISPDKKLIIVPDGILGLLPFEALVVKNGKDYKDSRYVGDVWHISYSQSAAILALNRLLPNPEAGKPLFALGNPIFGEHDPHLARYKSKQEPPVMLAQAGDRAGHRALASHRDWGKTTRSSREGEELVYLPLPYTEAEVKAIADLYGVAKEPPDILLDLKATKANLNKSPLKNYRYLHFATHADLAGKVQGVNEPFILLGQVDKAPGDDGYLRMSEVFSWQLQADMVVLSACQTGRGKVMVGEGVANLARAFQQAGSKSVVVSLWKVADKEGMEYMKVFYGYLKAEKSRGEALRLARREIKARHPNPFYWGVFILHGEG